MHQAAVILPSEEVVLIDDRLVEIIPDPVALQQLQAYEALLRFLLESEE